MPLNIIEKKLQTLADKKTAEILQRFFKTGPGEYGEGDVFLGIRVPELRKLAQKHQDIPTEAAIELLLSSIHEKRLLALFIIIHKYNQGNANKQKEIYELYLKNSRHVNSWDLVDVSAAHIAGAFLMDKSKAPLYRLAASKNLWQRRIAIIATFAFIKNGQFSETLKISSLLLADKHDLIHKAVGWMLREVGKRDMRTAEAFLKEHCRVMPRTMLRYAIEKFPEPHRQQYLKGNI